MGRLILPLFKKTPLRPLHFILFAVVVAGSCLASYFWKYENKIYPNIKVAGVDLGGLDSQSAQDRLKENIHMPEKIKIVGQTQIYSLNTKDIEAKYDLPKSVSRAMHIGRSGSILEDIRTRLAITKSDKNIGLIVTFNETNIEKVISVISGQNSQEPIDPSVNVINGKIIVNKGQSGNEVDQVRLRAAIGWAVAFAQSDDILVPSDLINNQLSESEAQELKSRAEKYLGRSVELKFEKFNYQLKDLDIIKALDTKNGLDLDKLLQIIEKVSKGLESDPQNPKFVFVDGRVTEFQPALPGIKVQKDKLLATLTNNLLELETNDIKDVVIEIPVEKTPPEISTDKVNNLGIKELISEATTTYFHSIPSRVHNVALAASRINGILVAPGETFSFNEALGDVSQFTGYQQAYIISGGKTILGDGGGVCQVSTTLFRALLNAGLPIVERSPHAYRVGYYEQNSPPGFDATVYGPTPDLKFTNDTGNYILIQTKTDTKRYSLTFELYGTKDGRVAKVSKPIISKVVPAPEDRYQDDPSLPVGVVKQIDFKAAGARVVFDYSVSKNGEEIFKKTFVSNYRPWQAVYLRGTGPAR